MNKALRLGAAALAAAASLTAVSVRAQDADVAPDQWPETDASLSYIRNAAAEIERKTGMPFVAIDGTEMIQSDSDDPATYILYAEQENPISEAYENQMDAFFIEVLKAYDKGQGIANVARVPDDKIYLVTAPKLALQDYVSAFAPRLLSQDNKNFSLDKFLGPLTADDLVAFANYHEPRHILQDDYKDLDNLLDDSITASEVKQTLYRNNKVESEADSFAAFKFTSNTTNSTDIPRRIESLKIIAKLRLLGITTDQSDTDHDTYNALTKTIDLIKNAHDQDWEKVETQFTEMYQRLDPDKSLVYNRQAAYAATSFIRGQGGIDHLSDDQYRALSTFMAKAYAPSADQLLAVRVHALQTSSDENDKSIIEQMKQKFGPPTPQGEAYVAAHLKLADAAMKSGYVEAPAPEPAKPRPAKLGMR